MKSTKSVVLAALAVMVLYIAARVAVPKRQAAQDVAPRTARVQREANPARSRDLVRSVAPRTVTPTPRRVPSPETDLASSVAPSPTASARAEGQVGGSEQKPAGANANAKQAAGPTQGARPAQEPIQDPLARVALGFVGADADAELYWYTAINNPSLSAHERQDLIEDLNEDGLSDPQNPTAEDLPLILNRIQLIETVGWEAIDEVNADAFLEAYKDLVNLAIVAMGNG